jgi:hypothetical protein
VFALPLKVFYVMMYFIRASVEIISVRTFLPFGSSIAWEGGLQYALPFHKKSANYNRILTTT